MNVTYRHACALRISSIEHYMAHISSHISYRLLEERLPLIVQTQNNRVIEIDIFHILFMKFV